MPAFNITAWPDGQLEIAELIWLDVAPGFNVAQTAVRFGMPPCTPAALKDVARFEAMIPDQGCACIRLPQSNIRARDKLDFDLIRFARFMPT